MALTTKELWMDFHNQNITRICVVQNEKDTRRYNVHFCDDGIPIILNSTDYELYIAEKKADGNKVLKACTINNDGTGLLVFDENMCISSGSANLQFILRNKKDNTWTRTIAFAARVHEAVLNNGDITSSTEFDVLSKLIIKVEELDKLVNENEKIRQANEEVRKSNETSRIGNENTRISNENTRKQNETNRINAENTRAKQENTRQTNEQNRMIAENTRVSNENERIMNENTRKSNETQRQTNETNRISAENTRISAETDRQSNETARQKNESTRQTNENTRISNETDRANAEAERVKNENTRISNENTRKTQETKRQADTATAITNANNAAKNANDKANTLQSKLDNHDFIFVSDLENSVTSTSTTHAPTSNAVKTAYDKAVSVENIINSNKNNWNDKYTKNEIDNKFSTLESNIDWKESVSTYADIAKTYPNPQDGWTVNVKDTDYTYRYSGTSWVAISANAIPKATQSVDGLLSKEDKINYDDANSKKHTHSNKSVLDSITSTIIATWNKVTDKLDKTGDASNTTNTIATASTRENLTTGEKLSISLGKIKKWFADLKTVAFTGSYNDLSDKPSIPTVGNGTITITQNGTNKGTFTMNQSGNTTIALTDNNTIYTNATTSTAGLMSPDDKTTLNNLKTSAVTGVKGSAESTYRTGNINLTPANIGALALSGGTVTGKITEKQGHIVHTAGGSSGGKTGYIAVAKFTITGQYVNAPTEIAYCRRNDTSTTRLYVTFVNNSSTDPTLLSFGCVGHNNEAYMYKSATSTWKLYIKKTESYDGINIMDFLKSAQNDGIKVEWIDEYTATLPSGVVQAKWTSNVSYSINSGTVNGHSVNSDVPANAKFTDTNTTYSAGKNISLSGTQFKLADVCATITDWNATTTTGFYMASGASNAPVSGSVWFYGIVIAHNTNYVRQILYRFATDAVITGTNCDRYERVKHNGTWGSWVNTSVRVAVPSNAKFTDTTYTLAGLMGSSAKGSATQPVYWNGSAWANTSYTLGKSVPSNAVFTDTTYPIYQNTIDANFKSKFRTQVKGSSTNGNFLSIIRNNTANVDGAPQWSSGLAWGINDTQGYLFTDYRSAVAYIGGGSADILTWYKKISLDGHTHSYLPLSGGSLTGVLTARKGINFLDTDTGAYGWADFYKGDTRALSVYASTSSDFSGIIEGRISSKFLLITNPYTIQLKANSGNSNVDLFCANLDVFKTSSSTYAPVSASKFNEKSSKYLKENIKEMSEDEANKILDVNIVTFDFKEKFGGEKGCRGVIAEDVYNVIPSAVTAPNKDSIEAFKNDEDFEFDDITEAPSVAYSKFVPYLIKKMQMQEKELQAQRKKIEMLKERLGM